MFCPLRFTFSKCQLIIVNALLYSIWLAGAPGNLKTDDLCFLDIYIGVPGKKI